MAHSDLASLGGWRSVVVQTGLLVVGGFSVIILFSFGGQVVVAPALLPAQWIIARDTTGWISIGFSILGALLTAEVVYLVFALIVGETPLSLVVGIPLALACAALFYRTSRRRS